MKQLIVFCEGPTEQGFSKLILEPHLFPDGSGLVEPRAVGEKDYHHVYGLGTRVKYGRVREFVRNTIKARKGNIYFTTMFDLYALPKDFPGKDANSREPANPTPYALAIEEAFGQDIDCFRFIPHLQLHEYETLLFAQPEAFAKVFENCDKQIRELKEIVEEFQGNVERINDGPNTSPSKRIKGVFGKRYQKRLAGPEIAKHIGLATIRSKCPHFDQWLTQLEKLDWEAP